MRWTYPLALLGGLALVVAAQGSEQVGHDAVTVDDRPGSPSLAPNDAPASAVAGERSIRLVDFGEVDQPSEVCADALADGALSRIEVSEGRSGVIDELRSTRLAVDDTVAYGDITGDGIENAIVHTVCSYGANGTQHTLQVWDVSTGTARIAATITEPPAEVTGPLAPDVTSYRVDDGALEVVWTSYTDDDPNCCPSLETRIRYRLVGDQAVQLGEPVTTPANT